MVLTGQVRKEGGARLMVAVERTGLGTVKGSEAEVKGEQSAYLKDQLGRTICSISADLFHVVAAVEQQGQEELQ